MALRLAILDFDGTLADTFPWFVSVLNGVADRFGFRRVEEGEVDTLRGWSARRILDHLGVPTWKLPLIARHMHALADRNGDRLRLFAGADRLLEDLAASGVAIAVVSSNSEANVRRILGERHAGLVSRYECGASLFGKAAKFRRLLRATGTDPAEAVCIGDEIRDAEAARAAGIPFAAVAWGYTTAAALGEEAPAFLFERMDDVLPGLLDRAGAQGKIAPGKVLTAGPA